MAARAYRAAAAVIGLAEFPAGTSESLTILLSSLLCVEFTLDYIIRAG